MNGQLETGDNISPQFRIFNQWWEIPWHLYFPFQLSRVTCGISVRPRIVICSVPQGCRTHKDLLLQGGHGGLVPSVIWGEIYLYLEFSYQATISNFSYTNNGDFSSFIYSNVWVLKFFFHKPYRKNRYVIVIYIVKFL